MDIEGEWNAFIKVYPVGVDGKVPSLGDRVSACSKENQRKFYERWLKAQMKLRIEHVAGQYIF